MLYRPIQRKATQAKKANFMLKRKSSLHALFEQSSNDLSKKLSEYNHAFAQQKTNEREILEKILKTKNESLELEQERSRLHQKEIHLLTQLIHSLEKSNREKIVKIKSLIDEQNQSAKTKKSATSFFSPTTSSAAKKKDSVKNGHPSKKQPPMM